MARLSTERYLQARAFIYDRARPLERMVFEHDFERAPAWPVFDGLAEFQNDDGGFGNGLEPDSLTPASSALATSVGLRVLAGIGAPASHPMVRSAVDYLRSTIDPVARVWRIVPEAAGDSPHAPWWQQEGLAERFNGYRLNPKADIVAQLHALAGAAPRPWLDELTADVVATIAEFLGDGHAGGHGKSLEMHDLIGAVRLLDAPGVDASLAVELRRLLAPAALSAIRAAGDGGGYGLTPLSVAPGPDSELAQPLADEVRAQLDELIHQQADDGAWWPVWSWGDPEPESPGGRSRVAWAGVLTLDALKSLQAFRRIDRE
ncbi:MAG TPA: hypothetical protein VFN03_11470 [Trueperaceae bacterium]|nr:hypothetical protein [Trueperaceae bacterium]